MVYAPFIVAVRATSNRKQAVNCVFPFSQGKRCPPIPDFIFGRYALLAVTRNFSDKAIAGRTRGPLSMPADVTNQPRSLATPKMRSDFPGLTEGHNQVSVVCT